MEIDQETIGAQRFVEVKSGQPSAAGWNTLFAQPLYSVVRFMQFGVPNGSTVPCPLAAVVLFNQRAVRDGHRKN
jgi:hypothetical protein